MKFSNLDLQEIQKTGAAYIPVSLTYVDSNKNVKDSLLCVHDDKGVLDNGKNVVHEGTEKEYALQLLTVHKNMVERTKSILKTLKEKAINVANDTNTDADCAAIQKEVDQALDQIDENANVTFNGQTLLDGSKNDQVVGEYGTGTYTHLTNESFQDGTKTDTRLTNLKRKDGASVGIQVGDHITVSYIKDGKTYSSRNSTVGETIVSKTTRFGNIFDWSPCDTDLDIVHYSETSKIGLDRMAEPVYTLDGLSAISYHAKNPGLDGQISGLTICVTDSKGNPKNSTNATINNFHETIRAEDPSDDNALVFQTGTKANQSVKIGFTDMRATALGLRGSEKDGSPVCLCDLISISNPNVMLKVKDQAKESFVSSYPNEKDYTKHGQKGLYGTIDYEIHDALELNGNNVMINGTKYDKDITVAQLVEKGITEKATVYVRDLTVYTNGKTEEAANRYKKQIKLPNYYSTLKLYCDLVKNSLSEEKMRKHITDLVKVYLDLSIEKCDMSIDSDKKHRKEILATKK